MKLFLMVLLICFTVNARITYVDLTLGSGSSSYNPTTRSGTGGSSVAYNALQTALNNCVKGDTIYLRGGTYYGSAAPADNRFYITKSGTAWSAGNFFFISSYPGEWAVLDGQNMISGSWPSVIGSTTGKSYWWLERLEIKNGRNGGGSGIAAAGFHCDRGPFKIRYCYFHDNLSSDADAIPVAISGHVWDSCIVEYNYFKDNGSLTHIHWNAQHICMFSDYDPMTWAANGFTNSGNHTTRNHFRYNLFEGGSTVMRNAKGTQLLTGRNLPSYPYVDTYKEWGDRIHHNIVRKVLGVPFVVVSDFQQVYNNIIDSCTKAGIWQNYGDSRPHNYKTVIYNNTIRGSLQNCPISFQEIQGSGLNMPLPYYTYVFNNIFDSSTSYLDGSLRGQFTIRDVNGFPGNEDSLYLQYNYSYRPLQPNNIFYMISSAYTVAGLQAIKPNVIHYQNNTYSASNPLWRTRYVPYGEHVLTGSTTIANGGRGGNHPYLPGVTIPTYVGAVDPNDSSWVGIVLSLTSLGADYEPDTTEPPVVDPPVITSITPSSPRLLKDCQIGGVAADDEIYFNWVLMDSTVSSDDTSKTIYVEGITRGYFWLKAINSSGRDSSRVYVKNTGLDTLYIRKAD